MNLAASDLAYEVAARHGASKLEAAHHILVSFSSGGLAFTSKAQPRALTNVQARLSPVRQHVSLAGELPNPWTTSIDDSHAMRTRVDELRSGYRRLWWRPEDLGTFAASALWTYLMMPLLLDRAQRLDRLPDASGLRRLRVELPPSIGGHGHIQTLHVDAEGLIRRHDYTATAFGPWARAAQHITSYKSFDCIPIGTSRRVTPRVIRPLPFPTLVWIEIHSVKLDG